MITRIEIEGFRSIRDCVVDLSPFTVLVGQNGSGKTNLLEAVDLVGQLLGESRMSLHAGDGRAVWSDDLRPGGDRRGRVVDLFHRRGDGTVEDRLRVAVCFLQSDSLGLRHLRADVTVTRGDTLEAPHVAGEITLLPGAPAGWDLTDEQREQIRANAGSGHSQQRDTPQSNWHRLAPDSSAARQDPDLHDQLLIAGDAHNLSAVLGRLLTTDDGDTRASLLLRADAVALLPGLTDLRSVADVDRGTWEMDLVYRDAAPVPARLASDGTLHVLAVLAAAHDSGGGLGHALNACTTLMIEDVENGLHPGQVKELVRRLRRTTGSGTLQQIVVTTHSPVALAAVYPAHPGDVLFVDTVTRVGGGEAGSRHTRVRPLAESGERGAYVPAREARQYLETAQAGSR